MSRTDPKLNQIVNPIEDKKVQVSRPLLKGFWYLDRFSTKARSIIVGTLTNESTPSSLIGITLDHGAAVVRSIHSTCVLRC